MRQNHSYCDKASTCAYYHRVSSGYAMSKYEFISILVGALAVTVSAIAMAFVGIQARRASQTFRFTQQIERSEAVAHFTGQFLSLLSGGDPAKLILNADWAYRFWSLQSTEFYFFHHGILPKFIYTLWMVDLASLYSGPSGRRALETHEEFLRAYAVNYPAMVDFFKGVRAIACAGSDPSQQSAQIAGYVESWHRHHHAQIE
jgi:hypothetical protein